MWTAFKTRIGQNAGWAATALIVAAVLLGLYHAQSSTTARVATAPEGEAAPAVGVPAPLTPRPTVPVARLDTGGRLSIGELPLADPLEVEATVTVGASDSADATLVLRRRRLWFPELRAPAAGFSVEVLEGSELPVTVAPRPRALLQWQPRPALGLGAALPGGARLWAGLDLARIGPVHAQLGLTTSLDSATPALDLAPAAGLRLREGLMIGAGYELRARRPFAAIAYRF